MTSSPPDKSLGRYAVPSGPEAQFEPGSRGRVLRNKLGIRSKRLIDREEFEALVDVQESYMARVVGPTTRFTARLLREMHRDWLGGIYEWAGCYRTVNVSKGGFAWPPAHMVPQNMQRLELGPLKENTPCLAGPIAEAATRMAVVHAEFLLVHPFRDGNGRIARWLADLMALQAGYPRPHYNFRGRGGPKRREQYLKAVKAGYLRDYRLLGDFFAQALGLAVTREGLSAGFASKPRAPSKKEDSNA